MSEKLTSSAANMITIRTALRTVHLSAPEAGAVLEKAIDILTSRIEVLQSADPFRALVLSMAEAMTTSNSLSKDIRTSILEPLAKAEADKEARLLLEAQHFELRVSTWKQVLTQPVALGIIGIITTVLTTISTWILRGATI